MISIYSPDHALHDPPFEFLDGALVPVFESPRRAEIISAAIVRAGLGPLVTPRSFGLEPIRAVHSDEYLAYLEHIYDQWVAAGGAPESVMPGTLAVRWMERPCPNPIATPGYYCFDLSAPIVAGTYAAARAAANVALTGAALLQQGQRAAYALCRPPGHHAGRDLYGGYCYLNNAAIAAQALLAGNWWQGNTAPRRVAILDIDYHHGNGTQQIFYERDDVLFVSIHADPARQYPYFAGYADECGAGAGSGYNLNIPLEADVDDRRFLEALDQALRVVSDFKPRSLVVSAGFDTFGGDPIADFALTVAAYPEIGGRIARLDLPTLIVQEGGYAVEELGQNVAGLLQGFIDASGEGL